MRVFKIELKMTKRGCQMKVSSKYRNYYRYFQTMKGALAYAKNIAISLQESHKRCDNISLFIEGEYQEDLAISV